MPINRVDMYQAVCDGCGRNPSDRGSDYWAWADEATAREEWADSDFGTTLDSGRVYCWDCAPPGVCRYNQFTDYKHVPSDEDPTMCAECDGPIPAAADPAQELAKSSDPTGESTP